MRASFLSVILVVALSCTTKGAEGEGRGGGILLPIATDSGWGAIRPNGDTVFVLKGSKDLGTFSEGLAPFSPDGVRYGYVDTTGRVVISARFKVAEGFKGGVAVVKEDLWGVIGRDGRYRIAPKYLMVIPANFGRFWVRLRNVWRLMDTSGRYVGDYFEEFYPFTRYGWAKVKTQGSWGVMDTAGRWLVPPKYASVDTAVGDVFLVRDSTGWGYVSQGRVIYWREVERVSIEGLKVAPEVKIKLSPPNLGGTGLK